MDEDRHLIELEMAYTKYAESCREPHPFLDRVCRRAKGHENNSPECASGIGENLVTWSGTPAMRAHASLS